MTTIRLDDVFAARGLVEVKRKDFLKNVVKRMTKGGFKAGQKPLAATGRQPERAKETDLQGAERQATDAKKKADTVVKSAAAKGSETQTSTQKRLATIAKSRKATMKAALAGEREKRMQRKSTLKAKMKASSVSTGSAAKQSSKADGINAQVAHCMLALHYKRGKDSRAAWNICRASLTKTGYLKPPYREDGKAKDVRATQKGSKRAMQHAFEKHPLNGGIRGTPAEKFSKFRTLFRDIEPTV